MKVAVLKTNEASEWASLKTITENLLQAYQLLPSEEFKIYHYNIFERDSFEDLLKHFKKEEITRLVILDNMPRPAVLIKELHERFRFLSYYPEIHVHSYGCIRFWLQNLLEEEEFLNHVRFRLFVGSEAQKNFLKKFFKNDESISVCPFPLEDEQFGPPPEHRDEKVILRERFGFASDDKILIFTGRAHLQKNLHLFLEILAPKMKADPRLKIIFCGDYDDSGIPMLGIPGRAGYVRDYVRNVLAKYEIQNQFFEVGPVSRSQLKEYLWLSDAYVSLSLYNDEDFGYGPLEALASGTPAVITSWAGYRSFTSPWCFSVNVTKTQDDFVFDSRDVLDAVDRALNLQANPAEISKFYLSQYSLDAVADLLASLHSQSFNFAGFSSYFKSVADLFPPDFVGLKHDDYLDLYKEYVL
jgi:glycosyltransferase involved in cell wall biosynthesis